MAATTSRMVILRPSFASREAGNKDLGAAPCKHANAVSGSCQQASQLATAWCDVLKQGKPWSVYLYYCSVCLRLQSMMHSSAAWMD